MKKLLLLLLLPSLLLAQEDKKPRKLFFEIKQGVGFPSFGAKFKSEKGNYWNVGANIGNLMFPLLQTENSEKEIEFGPYISHSILLDYNFHLDMGATTIIDSTFGGFISYVGVFYGKKVSVGFNIGMAHIDNYIVWKASHYRTQRWQHFMVFSPRIKFRI